MAEKVIVKLIAGIVPLFLGSAVIAVWGIAYACLSGRTLQSQ
jgi:hypothetical protein